MKSCSQSSFGKSLWLTMFFFQAASLRRINNVSVSHGKFPEWDTCQAEEKQRDLMRRRTSWCDAARLVGTHTGNRIVKWLLCVYVRVCMCACVWTGYTLRSVPPRQLSSWEQYHLSLGATRQWRPDGEQRVEDGTKCRPKQGHQIKFFRYSWCQEPMVLLFISVCIGNSVHGHLSFSFLNSLFVCSSLCPSLFDRHTYWRQHEVIDWYFSFGVRPSLWS